MSGDRHYRFPKTRTRGFRRQSASAASGAQSKGGGICVAIPELVAAAYEPVSPAISHATANGREPTKIEANASKSCNQSGGQRSHKPNCYECQHRRPHQWSAHSMCVHPRMSDEDRLVAGFAILTGVRSGAMKRLNISGNQHGINNGWFLWPLNFDPVWLETCDGFLPKIADREDEK